jgi:hypothetical protein
MADPRSSRAARTIVALDRRADRPWFLPAIALFPMSDYVLPVLPNQMMLLGLAMLRPARWIALIATFVLATALGALLTAWAIQYWGRPFFDAVFADALPVGTLAELDALVTRYGTVTLALLAMLPWPPRTGVIACALFGLSPATIGLAVAIGRIVPTTGYALAGAHAPRLLRGWPRLGRLSAEVQRLRQ